jgi:hypothetical protein
MPEYYIQDISENLTDCQYTSLCQMYDEFLFSQMMEKINEDDDF